MRAVISGIILISIGLWISNSSANYEESSIKRPDGTLLHYILRTPDYSGYPIILTIQGSACESIHNSANELANFAEVQKWGQLWLEKYGINQHTRGCPREYLKHNSIDQRVYDYSLIIDELNRRKDGWNGDLYVMGISEGAWIAPMVAAAHREAKRLIIISGSGSQTLQENYETLVWREMHDEGKSEDEIQKEINSIRSAIAEIKKNPTPDRTWLDSTSTYFYWNSFLPIRPLDYMLKFDGLILMIHGTADDEVAVEGAQEANQEFIRLGRKNLTYRQYQGTNHMWYDSQGYNHWFEMLGDALRWIH